MSLSTKNSWEARFEQVAYSSLDLLVTRSVFSDSISDCWMVMAVLFDVCRVVRRLRSSRRDPLVTLNKLEKSVNSNSEFSVTFSKRIRVSLFKFVLVPLIKQADLTKHKNYHSYLTNFWVFSFWCVVWKNLKLKKIIGILIYWRILSSKSFKVLFPVAMPVTKRSIFSSSSGSSLRTTMLRSWASNPGEKNRQKIEYSGYFALRHVYRLFVALYTLFLDGEIAERCFRRNFRRVMRVR